MRTGYQLGRSGYADYASMPRYTRVETGQWDSPGP